MRWAPQRAPPPSLATPTHTRPPSSLVLHHQATLPCSALVSESRGASRRRRREWSTAALAHHPSSLLSGPKTPKLRYTALTYLDAAIGVQDGLLAPDFQLAKVSRNGVEAGERRAGKASARARAAPRLRVVATPALPLNPASTLSLAAKRTRRRRYRWPRLSRRDRVPSRLLPQVPRVALALVGRPPHRKHYPDETVEAGAGVRRGPPLPHRRPSHERVARGQPQRARVDPDPGAVCGCERD